MSRVPEKRASGQTELRAMQNPWPEPFPSQNKQNHRKPSHRSTTDYVRSQPQKQGEHELKAGKLSKALMYMTLTLLLTLMFVQIGRLAQIAGQTKQISSLSASIRQLNNEKANLEVRLSMQQNINRVRDEAVYKLGMIHPDEGQIRVISLNGYYASAQTQMADKSSGAGAQE